MLLVRGVSVRTWPEVLVGKSKKREIDARDAARGRDFNWLLTECVLFRSNDVRWSDRSVCLAGSKRSPCIRLKLITCTNLLRNKLVNK